MISVKKLCLDFGSFQLLNNISFLINKNDKLGLVGRNGAGKTSLLKIISGLQGITSGNIEMPKDIKIGYLPQEKKFSKDISIFEEAMLAFEEELEIRNKIASIQNILEYSAHNKDEETLMKFFSDINDLNERYLFLDGDSIEKKTERILLGLGFEEHEFNNSINTFSEGWQMRVELAKILLKQNDILLLDEPTNHLDIESIQWLEDYLVEYKGAIILVSHDRMFLDKVTNRTIEINLGKIYDYPVSYTKYVKLRDERIEQQKKDYNAKQREIQEIEKFIEKFRYKATKAKQVQSRIKMVEKMDVGDIDEINASEIHFRFPNSVASGKIVVECDCLSKSYDSKLVLNNISFIISSGQKIAFVGKNGQGKSTLSKVIADGLSYDGFLKLGHNVNIGYFPQNAGKFLDDKLTVLETAEKKAHKDYLSKARSILGNFLFSGDDVNKKVSVLSGGEKSRLALATLMCKPSNFLVLDEPTNHLDMVSKEILKYALINYKGTLVIVSHDRDFLEDLTDMVFYFNNHIIKQYPGRLSEFLSLKKIADIKTLESLSNKSKCFSKDKKDSDQKIRWEQKKQNEKDLKRLKNQLQKFEADIEKKENEISAFEVKMNNIDENADGKKLFEDYAVLKKDAKILMNKWENIIIDIEEKENLLENN